MHKRSSLFSELEGKTLISVVVNNSVTSRKTTADSVIFMVDDGSHFEMYHDQDCCEGAAPYVSINDFIGDVEDLINTPILLARHSFLGSSLNSSTEPFNGTSDDSTEWTFYKIRTIKGTVDIRWVGHSHYYAIGVSFYKMEEESVYLERRAKVLADAIQKIEQTKEDNKKYVTRVEFPYDYDLVQDLRDNGYYDNKLFTYEGDTFKVKID